MTRVLALVFLLAVVPTEIVWAQAESSAVPARVEAIRQRIAEIQGGPMRRAPEMVRSTPSATTPADAPRTSENPRLAQRLVTQQDLDRLERRLVRQFTRLLADERYRDRLSALLDQTAQAPQALPAEPDRTPLPTYDRLERPAPLSPDIVRVGPDTIRIEPDTVYMVRDTVQLPPDTIRETTVVEVQRALLDTGVFRAFEVNFAFGESTLLPRATRSLDVVGKVLAKYPELRVEVAGHTDAVGAEDYNRTLSDARAQSVREYLINRFGIDLQRLVARGYGEARPIATNETEAGRALNRRVEFIVLNPEAAFRRDEGDDPSGRPAADEAGRTGQDLETMVRRAIQEELERQRATPPDTTGSDSNR